MGAVITRHASGDGAPTLTLSEEILFKVNRGARLIYSTLLSLLRRDAPSPEHELVFRREQWVRISDAKIDAPKPGYALVVDPATTAMGSSGRGRRKAAVRTRDVSGARGAARVRREGRSPERPSR